MGGWAGKTTPRKKKHSRMAWLPWDDHTKYGFLKVDTNLPIGAIHVRSLTELRRENSKQPAIRKAGKNTLAKPDV